MNHFLEGLFTSLAAAGAAELVLRVARRKSLWGGIINRVWNCALGHSTLAVACRKGPDALGRFFVDWLKHDQSIGGAFDGQFGARADRDEQARYAHGREPIAIKPRLYLTGWPCFVLSRRHAESGSPRQLGRARDGLLALLDRGAIHVAQAAIPGMSPVSSPREVSYRHTLRALQILAALDVELGCLSSGIARVLDREQSWQNPDGGWSVSESSGGTSDLFASVYAAGLILGLRQRGFRTQSGLLDDVLAKTIGYIEGRWLESKWSDGGKGPHGWRVSAEQNAPQVFCEVHEALTICGSRVPMEFRDWLGNQVVAGALVQTYIEKCGSLSLASVYARAAYALHRCGCAIGDWFPLYVHALTEFTDSNPNSADVAFLLDMTYEVRSAGLSLPVSLISVGRRG